MKISELKIGSTYNLHYKGSSREDDGPYYGRGLCVEIKPEEYIQECALFKLIDDKDGLPFGAFNEESIGDEIPSKEIMLIKELADRLEWAINVFKANGDFSKLPWHEANDWMPYAERVFKEAREYHAPTTD